MLEDLHFVCDGSAGIMTSLWLGLLDCLVFENIPGAMHVACFRPFCHLVFVTSPSFVMVDFFCAMRNHDNSARSLHRIYVAV